MEKRIIKLEAEIDLNTYICRVKAISGNKWQDFGYYLEVLSFMATNQDRPLEEMAEYAKQYILKGGKDYGSHQN